LTAAAEIYVTEMVSDRVEETCNNRMNLEARESAFDHCHQNLYDENRVRSRERDMKE
jgi:hypothetical protein